MDGPLHRQWMYNSKDSIGRGLRDEWLDGMNMFGMFAKRQEKYKINGVYRCLC